MITLTSRAARQVRSMQGQRPVDWIVMRNRLSSIAARSHSRTSVAT